MERTAINFKNLLHRLHPTLSRCVFFLVTNSHPKIFFQLLTGHENCLQRVPFHFLGWGRFFRTFALQENSNPSRWLCKADVTSVFCYDDVNNRGCQAHYRCLSAPRQFETQILMILQTTADSLGSCCPVCSDDASVKEPLTVPLTSQNMSRTSRGAVVKLSRVLPKLMSVTNLGLCRCEKFPSKHFIIHPVCKDIILYTLYCIC